jgi:hypothetical protein
MSFLTLYTKIQCHTSKRKSKSIFCFECAYLERERHSLEVITEINSDARSDILGQPFSVHHPAPKKKEKKLHAIEANSKTMINIDVLLKAAEFLESQLILNSDASSSSSSSTTSSTSDLAANSLQPLQTQTTHNNCGYSSSSSSGYSSTESNERTSISSTLSDPYGTMHLTSRHMNAKSTVNTKVQPHILSTTNGTTSTGRRNGYQAKRLVYSYGSKSKLMLHLRKNKTPQSRATEQLVRFTISMTRTRPMLTKVLILQTRPEYSRVQHFLLGF